MATKTRKTPAATVAAAAPQLQFIDLDKIRALAQVRTEFDQAELEQLAASIKVQGILQPILLRPDPDAIDSFIIIAGERRVRAAHIAGLRAVPALIGNADDAKSAEMQLVENIQREELSLADTAAAVLALYETHQKFAPIVELTGKSKAWVSKHITAAKKLNFRARMLLDSGKTDDLELILTVSQIEALGGKFYPRGDQLVDQIEAGQAGRAEARALLATMKEEIQAANKAKGDTKKGGKTAPAAERAWSPWEAMSDLHDGLMETDGKGFDLDALLALWTPDQAKQMCALVNEAWTNGNQAIDASKLETLRYLGRFIDHSYANTEPEQLAAFNLGAAGIDLSLRDLAVEWKSIVNP